MENQIVSTFKERFREALEIRNMKQIEISEKTKIPKGSINHYLSGYSEPKTDKLYLIAKALNVNEAWLMGYDTQMEKRDIRKEAQSDAELLILYRKLNDNNKSIIKEHIKFLLNQQSQ